MGIIVYSKYAWTYLSKGYYQKSLKYYKKAIEKSEIELGKNHSLTATTYNNIALGYKLMGNHDEEALYYFEKAVTVLETNLEKDQPNSATTYNNIAQVCRFKGDYAKALDFFLKALEIKEKESGEENLSNAIIYNNIAGVYETIGDNDTALSYYKLTLESKKSYLDKEEIDVAKTYSDIARVYKNMGHYDEAFKYYDRALNIQERVLGEYHFSTIETHNNIMSVYREMGEYQKALDYYKKSKLMYRIEKTNYENIIRLDNDNIGIILMERDREDVKEINEIVEAKGKENKLFHEEMELIQEEKNRIRYRKKELEKTLDRCKLLIEIDYGFLRNIDVLQLGRLDMLYRIMKSVNIDWKIVTRNYSDLSLKEKCQHYYVYKTWSILNGNSQFHNAFIINDYIDSFRECGPKMEKCLEEIKNDHESYITLELRQLKNYIDEIRYGKGLYERLGKRDGNNNLLVDIDEMKAHYNGKAFTLDHLPPPIYEWDVIFKKKDDPSCDIEYDSFSSGEKQMLNSIGSIIYHLQNLASTFSGVMYNNVNLIMEEIELYYHPEYQRQFFNTLLNLIQRVNLENIKNINIVFVTHSPFILSDVPKCNVLFLKDGMPDDELQENTFGANIHSLLKHGFFMPNLPIGEFAYGKINALFKKLNTGDFNNDDEDKRKKDLNDIYQQILLVGEPFLRNQLLLLYNAFKGSK